MGQIDHISPHFTFRPCGEPFIMAKTLRRNSACKKSGKLRRADANLALDRFFSTAQRLVEEDAAHALQLLDQKVLDRAKTTISTMQEITQKLEQAVANTSKMIEEVLEEAEGDPPSVVTLLNDDELEEMRDFKLNDRVFVDGYDGQGTIRFIGQNVGKRKPRIGIELDGPYGRSSGTFGGHVGPSSIQNVS